MYRFKKIAFLLLIFLLLPLGFLAGAHIGGWHANKSIQSDKEWQSLGKPPTHAIETLGFCEGQICVKSTDGRRYLRNTVRCSDLADNSCWHEIGPGEIEPLMPRLANSCMYEFEMPSPPPDTVQLMWSKECSSGGDIMQSFALLEDGSIWMWSHSIYDLAGLVLLPQIFLTASAGLVIGLMVAIGLFSTVWPPHDKTGVLEKQ